MAISPAAIADQMSKMFFGTSSSEPEKKGDAYDPTPVDIVVVRTMMCRAKRLPPDIVDVIFDHAEYWAHSTNQIDYLEEHKSPLRITGSGKKENRFLVSVGGRGDDYEGNPADRSSYAPFPSASSPSMTGGTCQRSWPMT